MPPSTGSNCCFIFIGLPFDDLPLVLFSTNLLSTLSFKFFRAKVILAVLCSGFVTFLLFFRLNNGRKPSISIFSSSATSSLTSENVPGYSK